jgi:hypothetical protein
VNKLLAFICAAAVALLALITAARMAMPAPFDPVAYEKAQIAINQAHAIAPFQTAAAAVLALVPAALAVICLALLAAWGSVALIRFRRLAQPDDRGLLPVNLYQLADVAPVALGAYHGARQIEAARQPVPNTITYAPHDAPHYAPHVAPSYAPRLDYRADSRGIPLLPADEPDDLADGEVRVPSFAELLSAGRIGRGQPLMLGHDIAEGAAVWGSWRDLYSAGVGGAQGGGKSWTAASLIAQSMLNGAKVILCDPHAGDEESLTTRLSSLLPYMLMHADNERQIEAAARFAGDELQRRREKKSTERTPILLVIDEWTSLLRRGLAEKLPAILADLTQEGRKYEVNALLLAQRWSVEAAGGGDVRNTLTAHYVHRTRADEARMQTGLRGGALPDDTMQLQPGQSYLVDTRGNVRKVATPTMSAADLVTVAQLLGAPSSAPSPAPAERRIFGFRPARGEGGNEGGNEGAQGAPLQAHQDAPNLTAEEQRIVAAFLGGKSPSDLAAELNQGKASGAGYAAAARRVADVLRRALGQRR